MYGYSLSWRYYLSFGSYLKISTDGQGYYWLGNACSASNSQKWKSRTTKNNIFLSFEFDFKIFPNFRKYFISAFLWGIHYWVCLKSITLYNCLFLLLLLHRSFLGISGNWEQKRILHTIGQLIQFSYLLL